MKRSTQMILHMGILLSILMLETTVLYIGCSFRNGETFYIHIFPWALQVCIFYLVNEWLSDRGLSLNVFLCINLLFCAVAVYTSFLWFRITPVTMTVLLLQVLYAVSLVLCGAYFSLAPEKPQTLVICFDLMISFFLLFLFLELMDSLLPFDGFETAFLFISALVLLSMMLVRTSPNAEKAPSPGSFLPVAALIGLCPVAAAALALLISGQVRHLSDALVLVLAKLLTGIFFVLGLLADLLNALFGWLMTLLPEAETGAVPMENLTEIPDMAAAKEEAAFALPPALLLGALSALVLFLILFLFIRLRGKKLQKKKTYTAHGQVQKTGRFSNALRDALGRFREQVRFRICLIRKRRTPSAMALLVERYGRKMTFPRARNESVPAYLKRLADDPSLTGHPELSDALRELSRLICREYYAGESVTLSAELYKKIRSGFGI